MRSGWIAVHYKLLDWEWYNDLPTRVLFLHLLLISNYEDHPWNGGVIKRGQALTSLRNLALETGLTLKQIRRSLGNLQTTSEVAHQGTHRYSIITVCNYDTYQHKTNQKGTLKGTLRAHRGHTIRKQDNKETRISPPEAPSKVGADMDELLKDFPGLDTPNFRTAWTEKVTHRKERGDKAYTTIGIKKLFKQMDTWGAEDAIRGINESITNDWRGIFPPKKGTTYGNNRANRDKGTANEHIDTAGINELFRKVR